MKTRDATLEDLPALVDLATAFHEESKVSLTFDRDSFCRNWEKLLSSGAASIFVAENARQEVKAMLGAMVYPDINSSDLVATEMFWYSSKDARGCGLPLFLVFEEWAKKRGARHIIMVHLSNLMPDKLRRFYVKKGYAEAETHYMKELE